MHCIVADRGTVVIQVCVDVSPIRCVSAALDLTYTTRQHTLRHFRSASFIVVLFRAFSFTMAIPFYMRFGDGASIVEYSAQRNDPSLYSHYSHEHEREEG